MSSRCPDLRLAAAFVALTFAALAPARAGGLFAPSPAWLGGAGAYGASADDDPASHVLRVCADPDNLPYSRRDGSGFENRIAQLMADSLRARLEYVWTPPQRGYVRKTLNADACDVLIGVPAGFSPVLTTRPYYRSSYVFVRRADAAEAPLASFDDPRITTLRIGVALLGDEAAATPPAQALVRAGAIDNVVGYTVYGHAPVAARMTGAVADGAIDAALVWGPQAGWYAQRAEVPLRLDAPEPPDGTPSGFEYSIAMGVQKGHEMLRAALDRAIEQHRGEIDAILRSYNVPRADGPEPLVGRR